MSKIKESCLKCETWTKNPKHKNYKCYTTMCPAYKGRIKHNHGVLWVRIKMVLDEELAGIPMAESLTNYIATKIERKIKNFI